MADVKIRKGNLYLTIEMKNPSVNHLDKNC